MSLSTSNSKPDLFRFLKNFGMFSFILLLINVFFWYTLQLIPQYKNYFKITEPSEKVKVVILSDSRGNVIKDRMLPDSIANLSYGSDSYQDMLSKMSYALKNFPNLHSLIITVDEHCFLSYRAKYNNSDKSILFADYETYNKVEPTKKVNFELSKLVSYYLPLTSKKNASLVSKYYETLLQNANSGTKDKVNIWCLQSETVRAELEKQRFTFQFNTLFDPSMSSTFSKICTLASKQHLRIIGVKFPVTFGYRKLLQAKKFPEVESSISKMNIQMIDYTNENYDDCLFENQDHLNNKGAELLVGKLIIDIGQVK
jgi:hypothetical protein